jgi:hypothetical protein
MFFCDREFVSLVEKETPLLACGEGGTFLALDIVGTPNVVKSIPGRQYATVSA